jgi:hypothetical protein
MGSEMARSCTVCPWLSMSSLPLWLECIVGFFIG